MPKKKVQKTKKESTKRAGLVPGQYRKRSTVYVERLRRGEDGPQSVYATDDLYTTDPYMVITNREDRTWTHTVELRGTMMKLPGKVIDRIISQREAIIKEQRQDRGRDQAARLKATGEQDQREAEMEAEMSRDLGTGGGA